MIIALGSTSDDKKNILKLTLDILNLKASILCCGTPSGITNQPLDKITTIKGAINRSREALKAIPQANIGVGLEGGLVPCNNNYSLICVCAISTTDGKTYTAESAPVPLPSEVATKVKKGIQFGTAIRKYQKERPNDNIQVIDELVSRKESFNKALQKAFKLYLKANQN